MGQQVAGPIVMGSQPLESLQTDQGNNSNQAGNFRPYNILTSLGSGAEIVYNVNSGTLKKTKVFPDDTSEDEDIAGL